MYAHFYHLTESPFNLTPDPKFQYVNESTREALASILYGIKSRKGFITLIGEAGTGKTTLLKRVLDEIEGETVAVFVFNPGVSFDELLEYICTELGVSTDGRRRLTLLERLNRYLLKQLTEDRNVVVMIDEAQTMDDSVLEELRLLSNLETSKEKILQILLSGQPELDDKLKRPGLRQLRQRVGVRATLKPMRANEIGAYVATRLRSAGASRADLFTQGALASVWRAAQGIPRVINVICDNAMMIAFAEGRDRITAAVMRAAIRDLNGENRVENAFAALRGWFSQPIVRYATVSVLAVAIALPLTMGLLRRGISGAAGLQESSGVPGQLAAVPEPQSAREDSPGVAAEVDAAIQTTARATGQRPVGATAKSAAIPGKVAGGAELAGPAPVGAAESGLGAAPVIHSPVSEAEQVIPRMMEDSIRRAELLAGSTAARLFEKRKRREVSGAGTESAVAMAGTDGQTGVIMRSERDAEEMTSAVFNRWAAEESGAETSAKD